MGKDSLGPWLKLCVKFRTQNGNIGHHLAVFSVDIAFSCHFMALHHPHPPLLQECLWYWLHQGKTLKWWAIQLAMHSTVGV